MDGWTAEQCADYWSIRRGTWDAYVARNQAPKPIGFHDHTGRRVWNPAEVQAQRPGAKREETP